MTAIVIKGQRPERESTVYHEARHAVAAHLVRFEPRRVSIPIGRLAVALLLLAAACGREVAAPQVPEGIYQLVSVDDDPLPWGEQLEPGSPQTREILSARLTSRHTENLSYLIEWRQRIGDASNPGDEESLDDPGAWSVDGSGRLSMSSYFWFGADSARLSGGTLTVYSTRGVHVWRREP
jgi:hypothetical protein